MNRNDKLPDAMTDSSTCPVCGTPLARGSRRRICPTCQLCVTLAGWANWEHAKAQRAEQAVKEGLSHMRIREAEQDFAANDSATALAALARELRDDPSNQVAAARLVSALTERNFPLPTSPLVRHVYGLDDDPWGPPGWPIAIRAAEFSPDGRLVLTASEDNTVRIYDARTLQPCTQPLKHSSRVVSARFGPDSSQVLTVAEDGAAAIWESEDDLTGQALRKPLTQVEKINHAEFSPDGRWVLTASDDQTARLWDAHTGQPTGRCLKHRMGVEQAKFSPDGRFILTFVHWDYGSPEDASLSEAERNQRLAERVTLWDVATSLPLSHPSAWQDARTIEFSPDGQRVLVVGAWAVSGVFDTLAGDPIQGFEVPPHHGHDRFFAKLSPDGQRFVTVAEDATARLWDARTGKALTEPLQHDQEVACAEFSPDGLRLVTVTEDSIARVWDAVTGDLLSEPVRSDYCGHAHFSPDGERLLVAGWASIQVWDIRPGSAVIESVPGIGRSSPTGRFSPTQADVMLANPRDGQCQTWKVREMRPLSDPFGYAKCVLRNNGLFAYERIAHFSLDGRLVFTIEGNLVGIWDAHTGEPKQGAVQLEGVSDPVQSPPRMGPPEDPLRFLFSPDGSAIYAADGAELKIWDTRTGRIRVRAPLHPRDRFTVAEVSPDGNLLAMKGGGESFRVWDAQTGKLAAEPYGYDGGSLLYRTWPSPDGAPQPFVSDQMVVSGRFSPDGKRLVITHADGSAWIWDARTGRVLTKLLKHGKRANTARFSSDGKYVLTASDDKTARVWDSHTGEPLMPALKHQSAVEAAEFSRDGRRIVTAAKDHTVRLWDARTGLALSEPRRHQGRLGGVEFSPDGSWVYLHARSGGCWDTAPVPSSAPAWLPELAEALAGHQLTRRRTSEPVPEGSLLRLKEELAMQPGDDYHSCWVRWFFADRSTRTISPHSAVAMETKKRRDSNSSPLG
ncbi:MAG: hypothetical protein NTW21_00905 [Verrucomicrobia bacterium]|nr:hypothetical protein [Verrucomicrobiota bacterium]